VLAALICALVGCRPGADDEPTRVRTVTYWEKWTGFEGEAADRMVAAFNEREAQRAEREPGYRPIRVQRVTVSRIEQKLLVAIAGGNPPDVAGMYSRQIAAYADKGSLTDLTARLAEAGIAREDYIPGFWDLSVYGDKVWAVPTAPVSLALHWNKRLFDEAGLDPDKPPATIEELDLFAEKLTRWEVTLPSGEKSLQSGYLPEIPASRKRLVQVGFLPSEPGWWNFAWGYYFGGELVQADRISAAHPRNVRAYEWVQAYSRRVGVSAIQRFRSGFGNFSSPQNPFLSGRIAMQLQGVWMHNFIEQYAPGLTWGAAPFPPPADRPELAGTTLIDADVLLIPKGSRQPEEAFEFLKFTQSQEGMEILCAGQRKFSSLRRTSEGFWQDHPHPYIRLFAELSDGKNAFLGPKLGVWNEYQRELNAAMDRIQNLTVDVKPTLESVQSRMQTAHDRNRRLVERRGGR
jgi:ABC-type glycerol-3-phosphate transport system substrate-binding protein